MRRLLAYCLVLGLAIILLMAFVPLWFVDRMWISEPNRAILGFETAMTLGILAFAIERIVSEFRR
jgi:hypothetical protein